MSLGENLNQVYLKNGVIVEVNDDESMALAKYIMLFPPHKYFTMGGVSFRVKDLDFDAKRLSKLPQQGKLDIRMKSY
jgi:hypothetical protein